MTGERGGSSAAVGGDGTTGAAAGREVGSPCISVCVIEPRLGYCIGCFRTLDEIADWINLDSAARLAVWDAIAQRRARAGEAPG